jgi:hypothetical protein
VHGELLSARGGRAGEQHRLAVAPLGDEQVVHGLVVEVGVVVVHLLRRRAVVPDDPVDGDPLPEVGLERVRALVEQHLQLRLVPGHGVGVGEVHQPHAGLPQVPLPNAPVRGAHEVAEPGALLEERGTLADIGVDPEADPQASGLQPLQHRRRVGERAVVPLEVAPLVLAHPEAVEVEDR